MCVFASTVVLAFIGLTAGVRDRPIGGVIDRPIGWVIGGPIGGVIGGPIGVIRDCGYCAWYWQLVYCTDGFRNIIFSNMCFAGVYRCENPGTRKL